MKGLVKFALDNGQPIDSALNGVHAIHAACCSNANVAVVLYLIERGADVNSRRLPRKYSNEKGLQTVGTTGSTPLHFAAANGCLSVVDILLRHGAIVDMTDKYGSSPLSVAAARHHPEVANLLRQYSAMQRGVQDLTPEGEVKSVSTDRRSSTDIHRGALTPPRNSSGPQEDLNTQPTLASSSGRLDRAARAPGQRRTSLPSIVESPSSPVILPPPRQSCDFDRIPQSTEPLVRNIASIRSTLSQPTRNFASPQPKSEERPTKLTRGQSNWDLEPESEQTRRTMRRSHTTHDTESSVLVSTKDKAAMKRRKSMESAGFLSPQSAQSVHRRKSFDMLNSLINGDSKSRRSSDASTASQGTSSSGTTRTSNTSISEATPDSTQEVKERDMATEQSEHVSASNSKGSDIPVAPLIRSLSQPVFENFKPRRLPALLASELNPRQSLDLQRLACNMDRSAEKVGNIEPRNDSDTDLPGLLFRRRTIQDTPCLRIGNGYNMGSVEALTSRSSSSISDEVAIKQHQHNNSTTSLQELPPRHSTGSMSSTNSSSTVFSGTATVSSRLSKMWSTSNSSSRDSLRDGSNSSSSSASNWNASEFGEASGEAAAQNLARSDSNRSKSGVFNRLSGIWSRK
ncbi:hypothetical protein BGZ76_000295 [Entomortierella beljakovae]|nr:hypothetical protein BGZ76_000295 [Entomortierella beljakovae]